jgi:uncharacterized membrane protein
MIDRHLRLLPWTSFGALTLAVVDVPLHVWSSHSMRDILMSPGMREVVILWLVPSVIVLFHVGLNRSLSDVEKRQWRRYLAVGGCLIALVYLCSADKRIPAGTIGDTRLADTTSD